MNSDIKDELQSLQKRNAHLSRVASARGEHDLAREAKELQRQSENLQEELKKHARPGEWIPGAVAFLYFGGSGLYVGVLLLRVGMRFLFG